MRNSQYVKYYDYIFEGYPSDVSLRVCLFCVESQDFHQTFSLK